MRWEINMKKHTGAALIVGALTMTSIPALPCGGFICDTINKGAQTLQRGAEASIAPQVAVGRVILDQANPGQAVGGVAQTYGRYYQQLGTSGQFVGNQAINGGGQLARDLGGNTGGAVYENGMAVPRYLNNFANGGVAY